jgi:hypothetical protein
MLALCVGGLGLASAIAQFAMVDAVNEKLSRNEQFSPFWWHPAKTIRLHVEYRRLYPTGKLLRRSVALRAVMFACLLVIAALLFFPIEV